MATSSSMGGGASLVVMATVGSEGIESCQRGRKKRKRGRRREGEKKERERKRKTEKELLSNFIWQIQISPPLPLLLSHPNC